MSAKSRVRVAQEISTTQTTQKDVFQCPDCEYNTTKKYNMTRHLWQHKVIPSATIFACTECDYKTLRKNHLKTHLLRHGSPENVNKHKCDKCQYTTIHSSHLKRHLQKHAKKRVYATEQSFRCDNCDYQTNTWRYLKAHSVTHRNHEDLMKCGCSECDPSTVPKKNTKLRPKDVTVLKCYHCSYETVRKSNLRTHLFRHRKSPKNMKTFQCYRCDFKTIWKHLLKEHLLLKCDLDSKNVEYKQVSTVNVEESVDNCKFECKNCNYETNRQSSFTTHLKQHENPAKNTLFYCNKCDFKTISESKRTAHYGSHKNSGDLKHRCGKCDFTTDSIRNMKRHSLAHTLLEGKKGGDIKRRVKQGSSEETVQTQSCGKGPPEDRR